MLQADLSEGLSIFNKVFLKSSSDYHSGIVQGKRRSFIMLMIT